jgi:bacteriocin biosynthesis cyclodehydratase domain-containing protein
MSERDFAIKLIDHYQVWQSEETLQIRGAAKSLVLKGPVVKQVLPLLLPLLDGSHTEVEVRANLAGQPDARQLGQAFDALHQRGLIERVEPVPPELVVHPQPKVDALARHFKNTTPARWAPLLAMQHAPIVVIGSAELLIPLALNLAALLAREIIVLCDPISASDIAHSRYLSATDAGVDAAEVIRRNLSAGSACSVRSIARRPANVLEWRGLLADAGLAITAFCMPIVFNSELEAINKAVLAEGIRWLPLAVVDNRELQVGPAVIPTETACYKCFEYRFRSNFTHLESYDHFAQAFSAMGEVVDFGVLGPFAEIAGNFGAIEAMKLLSPEHVAESAGKLVAFSLDTLSAKHHPVLRIPRCPHCDEYAEQCPERVWA